MHAFPVGIVTFLLTDIEGSTRLWETEPEAMAPALARHDALIGEVVKTHGGFLVTSSGEGDSTFSVFATASNAVQAACEMQRLLHREPWPTSVPLRVRMALHTGEAQLRDGDYYGSAVNRCGRLRSTGHGGQILASHAIAELIKDSVQTMGVQLRSLGTHRLKDLTAPEHVHQVTHPDLPHDFPALRSLDVLPHNLPIQPTRFIGRERELAEVRQLLGEVRLLTLTGTGGTGKTRIALQVAADLLGTLPDGVWTVALEALVDPLYLPQAVARALSLREQHGVSLSTTVIQYLSSRNLLLVLDNAEHVVTACAEFVSELMRQCPDVRVLVTSREPLYLSGETVWQVPPLTLPESGHASSLESLSMYEGVRLFLDRAAAALPGFAVTYENAPVIAEICHQLDGIPLALELAAARVNVLTVEQIAERLSDRFRLLTGGNRTVLPRQQTLRAAMDWSYDLLPLDEQALWRRLSVFSSSFTLEAAQEVCQGWKVGAWEVLDLLSHLVDKCLVGLVPDARENRYRLLETVRQYGRDKLVAAGEERLLRSQHCNYYMKLVSEARSHLDGMGDRAWVDRLEAEVDNIQAALDWCKLGSAAEDGLRLGAAMSWFWYHRGYLQEGLQQLNELLSLPGGDPSSLSRARALHGAGNLARYQQDPDGAERYEALALALFRNRDHVEGIAACMNSLANLAAMRQDFARAESLYVDAIAQAEGGEVAASMATAMSNLARLYLHQGRLGQAEELIERLDQISGQIGFPLTIRRVGVLRSMLLAQRGDYAEAVRLAEEMLAFAQRHGSSLNVMRSLLWLGMLRGEHDDLAETKTVLQAMLAQAHDLQVGGGTLLRLLTLAARWASAQGSLAPAARLLGAAGKIRFDDMIGLGDPEALTKRVSTEVRAALGEQVFRAEWVAGEGLSQAEVISLALQVVVGP